MSTKKHGLGRGLDALLPAETSSADALLVAVEKIRRNPRQPRTVIDPGELEELAASIREHGVIQPLIVSRGGAPEEYIRRNWPGSNGCRSSCAMLPTSSAWSWR
jgi:ParB family chromosome partitioning protein